MPINSAGTAEIFVVLKRSKIKMKTFIFLEWYGILLPGSLYEVHSLEKIYPVCNIPEDSLTQPEIIIIVSASPRPLRLLPCCKAVVGLQQWIEHCPIPFHWIELPCR